MPRATREQAARSQKSVNFALGLLMHGDDEDALPAYRTVHREFATLRAYADQLEADLRAADELADAVRVFRKAWKRWLEDDDSLVLAGPVAGLVAKDVTYRARREQDA